MTMYSSGSMLQLRMMYLMGDCTVGSFTREIEGCGSSKVEAYVDNQRWWSETVTFDGN